MTEEDIKRGIVLSSTVIRVPGVAHAASAPFTLLLIEAENGRHLLGHFDGSQPPPIGARVVSKGQHDGTYHFTAG